MPRAAAPWDTMHGILWHTTPPDPERRRDLGVGVPNIDEFNFDGAFSGGNGFGAIKKDPSLYDNFTKVIGSHT